MSESGKALSVYWLLPFLFIMLSLLAGMTGAVLVQAFYPPASSNAKPVLVSVDMAQLLSMMVRERSQGRVIGQGEQDWERQAHRDADRLQRLLDEMATDHGWVIMHSEAVVAGADDMTGRLQSRL